MTYPIKWSRNRQTGGKTAWIAIGAACGLMSSVTGCLLGPTYEPPPLAVPAQWQTHAALPDIKGTSIATDQVPEVEWWRAFDNEELNQLMTAALEKNHDVREAGFRVLEGRAMTTAAGAGLFPQLNVNGNLIRTRRSETILVAPTSNAPQGFAPPGAKFNVATATMDLQWELDLWGRIRRGMEAATEEAKALEMDRRGIMLSLMGDIGQSYFRLRELDEQIDIARNNAAIRKDSFNLISSRAAAGLASDLDVKRAQVLVSESAAQIPELVRLRAVEQHRLAVLTGSNPSTLDLAPRPLRAVLAQPRIPVGLPSDLLKRRPDILQAERRLIAANARIGEARAFFFPSFTITGNGGFQTSELSDWFKGSSRTFIIGPSITLPIFLGKTNVARLEASEARHEQMLEQYRQTILKAFQEVADLLVALQSRAQQLASQQAQVQAAREARELADIRYRKGLVTFLDVLDAQRTVLSAEQGLVQTERARLTDMVALFKAVGGGWKLFKGSGAP